MWFFTDNTDFVGGRTREQDPIAAISPVTYRFTRDVAGGRRQLLHGRATTIGGKGTSTSSATPARRDILAALDRHQAIRCR